MSLFLVFTILWSMRTIKSALFWIYLWQLKEYHIGRFIDHFRTYKGKKIFFNLLFLLKLSLLALGFFSSSIALYILLFIYAAELSLSIIKGLKRPVLTLKSVFLTFFSISLIISYALFADTVYGFLIFDILTPLIISAVVLIFQPFFAMARENILNKAKKKILQYNKPDGKLTVIAIVGSYGKTSTKEFLKKILSSKFNVLATPEHKNSEIGIARTILNDLKPEHQIFVVEMGAYNKGGINLLCDIVKPKIGIVTGVNEQHLATFKSMENLLSAEGGVELLNNLPSDGLLIVNGDNKHCLNLYKKANIKKKLYSIKKNTVSSDVWAEDIIIRKSNVSFIAVLENKEMLHFSINVLGKQNVQNLLGAILIAKELGMSLEEISLACKNITQDQSGLVLKKGIYGINIIDSSYSSNPDGIIADLNYLSVFPGKRIIIMPCLIELGSKSTEIHQQIGKKIVEVCDTAIITTKDKFEEIKRGMGKASETQDQQSKIIFSENPKEIFDIITNSCKEGDAVLLEGRVPSELTKLLIK